MKTLTINIKELDRKQKPMSTLVFDAFKKYNIPGNRVHKWYTEHTPEWLMRRLWFANYAAEKGIARNPIAYMTRYIENDYPLPEQFHDWFKSKQNQILNDPNVSEDLKRLISI